ncbi:MAG: ABC-2 type transport system permease protein [Methanobacteriota archaeon]|mgnify:CR=1 FL=1|uniref:ABC transporter permease n=1 Tax=Halorutilus salinus TaxID=2487751 RepID=A0A9Q4C5P8_9EURY|nr:ABC transporter permease [Halorutilus salinus]MCX2819557.1 ABC transporter permease [Halorutilus salinus]
MRRLRLARRELASLRSEKTVVLALAIQLFIAAFSSFLVVGLVSLYDPGSGSVEFAVAGDTDEIVDIVEDEDAWTATRHATRAEAVDFFERGDADAVLFVERPGGGGDVEVTVIAPRSDLRTTLVVSSARDLLERYEDTERERRAASLGVETVEVPEGEASPYHGFTYAVLVPLLMFLPVFISGSIAADSVTEEFERGTLDLLRVSPLSDAAVFDGKTATAVVIAPAQAALWLALLSLNGVVVASPVGLIALVAGVTAVAVGFGASVALSFQERKQAQFVYSVGVMAFFVMTFALPEPSANTVAKLAVGSATWATYGHVAVYVVLGAVGYAVARKVAGRKLS